MSASRVREQAGTKSPDAFRTISEVAEDLDLPQHVLRFWETRFTQIKPMKRGGGRRYYRPEDVDLLKGIRLLLYGEGFTIRGVQRLLKEKGVGFVVDAGKTGTIETVTAADMDAAEVQPPSPASPADSLDDPAVDRDWRDTDSDALAGEDVPAVAMVRPTQTRLGPEIRARLEHVLAELAETKRLLDQVRQG